jgi:hypothetical protein
LRSAQEDWTKRGGSGWQTNTSAWSFIGCYEFANFEQPRDTPWFIANLQETKEMIQRLNQRINLLVSRYGNTQVMTNEFKESLWDLNDQLKQMKTKLMLMFRL